VAGQIPVHAGSQDAVRIGTLASDAQSYWNLLMAIGGKEFRIGRLRPAEGSTMHGQVLIYDGDPSGDWSSWAIVFAKVPATPVPRRRRCSFPTASRGLAH
jgi:hypothetical protein